MTLIALRYNLFNSLSVLQWLSYFLCNAVFVVIIPGIKKTFFKKTWKDFTQDFMTFGKTSLRVFGIRAEFSNPTNVDLNKQYIIVANHRSWFDQISIMASFPQITHFLAKSDYFKVPFFKYCLRSVEAIPVYNKKLKQSENLILNEYLDRGDNVVFFAEGTRASGRTLMPFKKGAFKQAARTGVPILPMYILGSEDRLSKKGSILNVTSGEIKIISGKPTYFCKENLEEQIKEFEDIYTATHNSLYDDYEIYKVAQSGKKKRKTKPALS